MIKRSQILKSKLKNNGGFTLIEVISVLVILAILVAVAVTVMTNFNTEVYTGIDALKGHLRYAQTQAMNENPNTGSETIMGINYDSSANQYWMFQGTNTTAIRFLPDDAKYMTSDHKINLTAKKITLNGGGFTIYFDNHGIPYSAYTSSTVNTPLATGLTIVVASHSGSFSSSLTITPLTGFIP